MKIMLVRPQPKNLFNRLRLVCFEPLELEYLAAAALELGHSYVLYDGLLEQEDFAFFLRRHAPDLVALTGYTIHVGLMKDYAAQIKAYNPAIPVLAGGIHAELNWEDFYLPSIDVIVHTNPLKAFKEVITAIQQAGNLNGIQNICLQVPCPQTGRKQWQKNSGENMDPNDLPYPAREHLLNNRKKFRYFGQDECALVKTAWGCPYNCSFCYCGHLNQGNYALRDLQKVMIEIQSLPQEKIFIIDDTFLISEGRVREFCELIKLHGISKKFSIYARTDFICRHEELLPQLKNAGIEEIILGLEAMDDELLTAYGKDSSAHMNAYALTLLKKHGIASCALFIVDTNYSASDFQRLRRAVKKLKPDLCMFSIMTPLMGLPEYNQDHHGRIHSERFEDYDFLHLVTEPGKLSRHQFYLEFYRLYLSAYLDARRLKKQFLPLARSLFAFISLNLTTGTRAFRRAVSLTTEAVWDFWARRYEKLWVQKVSLAPTRNLVKKELAPLLAQNADLCLLDVGCGTGQLIAELASAHPNLHAVGIDLSAAMIKEAQGKAIPNAIFIQGNAVKLPFADHSFDIVTCCHSLPYYANQLQALQEFKRVLKPNGKLLVVCASVNNHYDRFAMSLVKLTTGRASYPSQTALANLFHNGGFVSLEQKQLPARFYIPSIVLTKAEGGLTP